MTTLYFTALRNHLSNDLNVNPVELAESQDADLEGFLEDLLTSYRPVLDLAGYDC